MKIILVGRTLKTIAVWSLVMVLASGISLAVNIWITKTILAPMLIGSYFGNRLGVWSHSQWPQGLTDTK